MQWLDAGSTREVGVGSIRVDEVGMRTVRPRASDSGGSSVMERRAVERMGRVASGQVQDQPEYLIHARQREGSRTGREHPSFETSAHSSFRKACLLRTACYPLRRPGYQWPAVR